MVEQVVEWVDVGLLVEHPRNVNRGRVDVIVESVGVNGWFGVLVVQRGTNFVLVGNHRLRAARELGLERVPVWWFDGDDEAALRVMLVDNRSTRLGFDDLGGLGELLLELGDLGGTGFGDDFLELLPTVEAGDDGKSGSGFGGVRGFQIEEVFAGGETVELRVHVGGGPLTADEVLRVFDRLGVVYGG